MKLQTKILLIFLPLTVVPLILMGWVAYWQLRVTAEDKTFSQTETLLQQLTEQFAGEVRNTEANARLFANSVILERYMQVPSSADRYAIVQPALMRLFSSYQRAFPDYYEIRVIRPDGEEDTRVTRYALPNVNTDEAESPFFSAARAESDGIYSALYRNPDNGEIALLVSAALRVRDPTRDPLTAPLDVKGYLVITRSLAAFERQLRQYGKDLGSVFVTDADGAIWLHSGPPPQITHLASDLFLQLQSEPGPRQVPSVLANEPVFFLARQATSFVYVVAALPERVLRASTANLSLAAATIILVAVVLTTLLIGGGLRYLVLRPIDSLTHAVREIGRGNFAVPIDIHRVDEFGTLSKSFQQMASSLQQSDEQIRYLAYHDSLTQLPNRLMLNQQLEKVVREARINRHLMALLYLDLDNFKQVNDTLGHHAGDELLKQLAARLSQSIRADPCRRGDESLARFGGDEFVLLLPHVMDEAEVTAVAEQCLRVLTAPFSLHNHQFHISASIGIAMGPGEELDAEQIIKHADLAMYHAKVRGKNNIQYFSTTLGQAAYARFSWESGLRNALTRNEFVLYYQPQVDLVNGRLRGVEALLRWQHPEKGLVPPADFMSIAEESGLILPLGRWVLREACRQARAWCERGMGTMRVAVNLSNIQLDRDNVLALVEECLIEAGLAARCLEIELTESSVSLVPERGKDLLSKIRATGVSVALDDFGTGYSSLSHLCYFPFDSIKIDRSFVRNIQPGSNNSSSAIIAAIIAMARSLNITVIAEGVETAQQADYLRAQGCDVAQGYFFGAPVPAHAMMDFSQQMDLQTKRRAAY